MEWATAARGYRWRTSGDWRSPETALFAAGPVERVVVVAPGVGAAGAGDESGLAVGIVHGAPARLMLSVTAEG